MKPLILLVSLAALASAGCSTPASMAQWQKEVQDFVTIEGNGDLNVLRDTENVSGRRILAVHGEKDSRKSTDIVGLMLGPRQVGGSLTYAFLVATVDKGVPRDIRLVALSRRGKQLTWRIGPSDPRAVTAYRRHHEKAGRNRLVAGLTWPARADVYELNTTATALTATELRSGAKWELSVGSIK